jgi:hypothetical protein
MAGESHYQRLSLKQYCVKLYSGENNNVLHQRATERHETEPPILRSEVENAMKYLRNNKASGVDEISGEMLKEMGEEGIDFFHALCNRVWSSREWPKDWTSSIFIPLHKKGSVRKCSNYRTIALVSHASKILLYIVNQRMKPDIQPQIPVEQVGSVEGKGTR